MAKKRKKANIAALRASVAPIVEMTFEDPKDPSAEFVFNVRELTPGVLVGINHPLVMRFLLNEKDEDSEKGTAPDTPEADEDSEKGTAPDTLESRFEVARDVLEYTSLICSKAIVDESGTPYLSEEECLMLIPPDWAGDIAHFAVRGILRTKKAEEASNDVADFPPGSEKPGETIGDGEPVEVV